MEAEHIEAEVQLLKEKVAELGSVQVRVEHGTPDRVSHHSMLCETL